MITQEMLDYIKQQTQQGFNREQIKNAFLASGWQQKDIEEGFNAVDLSILAEQNPSESAKPLMATWKIIGISLTGIVIIGIATYFVFKQFSGTEKNLELSAQQLSQEVKTQVAENLDIIIIPEEPLTILVEEKNTSLQTTDCGATVNFQNSNCFLNAARNCSPAKLLNSTQTNLFGLIVEANALYEIKGQQENKCLLYIKAMGSFATLSQELIQEALNNGATDDEIKEEIQRLSVNAQPTLGRYGTCEFSDTNDLVDLLKRWQEGSFSTEDFKKADCTGEYFGKGGQLVNNSQTITYEECIERGGHNAVVTDMGTACFKNEVDLGSVVGGFKLNDKYPQCCVFEQ